MSLHFVLDGYNILKQIPALSGQKLEAGRDGLVRFIEMQRPQGSVRNKVTVVFDGRTGMGGYGQERSSAVRVIFTEDEPADEEIKRLVAAARDKKSLVVVTNDRDIQYAVRALGAQVKGVADFLSGERSHQDKTYADKKQHSREKEKKDISQTLAYEINKELERIWLKKSSGDS